MNKDIELTGRVEKDFRDWLEFKRKFLGKVSLKTRFGGFNFDTIDIFYYLPMIAKFNIYVEFFEANDIIVELINENIGEFEIVTSFIIKEFTRKGWLETTKESFNGHGATYSGAWNTKEESMKQALIAAIDIYNSNKSKENDR